MTRRSPPTLRPVYEIRIERWFSAAHALRIDGTLEPLHGHNWHVAVALAGEALDDDGLLCDFHTLEASLDEIIGPFHNRNLNDLPPFDRMNPSAEHVARHIADALIAQLESALAPDAWIESVSVSEAPRCVATYRPHRS